jgi:two-component system, OmpR family, sensor histidine kinase TctE
LDNAICYSNPGGHISVKIEPGLEPRLIVEDDGPGIQTNEADRIFERFYRIPGSRGEGCGLGLAIVKEIADLHSARINIRNGPRDSGTRIEIVFGSCL